jgi:hypothetical protein
VAFQSVTTSARAGVESSVAAHARALTTPAIFTARRLDAGVVMGVSVALLL